MCGIAGIFNRFGTPPNMDVLRRMNERIAHRGPDGDGFFTDGGVALAHRALRIIDLSDAAIQPMHNHDGSLHLVFNGEVYNYVELRPELEARGYTFRSHSDSEVLLNAYEEWGVDCLQRLNGMFAFAIWDSRKERLFIARDRIGVKPVYYHWDGERLVFASEIKALLAYPGIEARPNFAAIAEYMNAMFTTGEHTWFEGIKRLLPGHYMLADAQGLQVRQWWDAPTAEDPVGKHDESYYVSRTRELLEDSVRLRLRSDVPLGAHLSGGLDSSSIVALLSRRLRESGEPVRTFSGAFAEGPAYDERRYVEDVVAKYGTEHHETLPTARDLQRLLDRIVWHMDEPAAGPGILLQWAVCRITNDAGVIVINGGQGGDEAWGGYLGYVPAYFRSLLKAARKHPRLLLDVVKSGFVLLSRSNTRMTLLKTLVRGRKARLRASTALGTWAGPEFKRAGVGGTQEEGTSTPGATQGRRSALGAVMYYDLKWYLPALLQVEDRTSMAFSLESRAPLLDYRLIELATSVPSHLKMKHLDMKHIFKEAVKDVLPASIYKRTDKMGMPTPVDIWFRESLASWVREQLDSPDAREFGLLDRDFVLNALEEHQSGARDRSLDLWKMLNLVTWWRLHIARTVPVPEPEVVRRQPEPSLAR
ncbi:MAG: asparagine synthase (glutamine-hydrolyzing) [Chloroflexota bacterium]|nr:asparagine synthase (glutamine-hydrolyzing) [Chloroflexota bacterium]MDQ5867488.1 asparagine synthase (glutamine-hydrolyzing) [Chloroflexota bacterium]